MDFLADLHVHSRFSRATSKALDLPALYAAARWKGISAVATGDCLHPAWLDAIEAELEPAEPGLFRLRRDRVAALTDSLPPAGPGEVRFILETEISNIYKRDGATRKNHNLVYLPDIASARRLYARLDAIGNLDSDGRPILGLDARDLLEITLETCPDAFLVPAHAWTPWFSLFGAQSGFDRLADCFRDLSAEIFAVETGLSSDPPMNWRVSELDDRTLISNSDAHSTATLGRNANRFNAEFSFFGIRDALRSRDPARCLGTIDLHPEEGKYHMDGHRACGVWMRPEETLRREGRCPACEKPVTVGVLHRVNLLADRPDGHRPPGALPFRHIIPLPEILSEQLNVGPRTKSVDRRYRGIIEKLGPELPLLLEVPIADVEAAEGPELAEAIRRMRDGDVRITPGFDGQYGQVRLFDPGERTGLFGQQGLFPGMASPPANGTDSGPAHARGDGGKEGTPDPSTASPKSSFPQGSSSVGGNGGNGRFSGSSFKRERAAETEGDSPVPERSPFKTASDVSFSGKNDVLLDDLNESQRAAVTHGEGPLIIVAGPGTGKTRTLTRRAAWLIREGGVEPESIWAITFTQRAAREMRDRLAVLCPSETGRLPRVATFHAFALEFLQAEEVFPGVLLEPSVQDQLLREARKSAGVAQPSPARLASAIGRAKARLLRPGDDLSALAPPEEIPALQAVYESYQARLSAEGALDFDDLILETVDRLAESREVRTRWRERIRHLLVDEYQDLNEAQYRLARLLSPEGKGLFVIGDPDQAIYGFRGADHRFFGRFTEDYPAARRVRLERNYRSTETILSASRQFLRDPFPDAAPVRSGIHGPRRLTVMDRATERSEAVAIGQAIERMTGGTGFQTRDFGKGGEDGDFSFGDIAVLYRSHAVGRIIREALEGAGIPCQTADRASGLGHPVLAPALAALRLSCGAGVFPDLVAAGHLLVSNPSVSAPSPGTVGTILQAAANARDRNLRVEDALAAAPREPADSPLAALTPLAIGLETLRAEVSERDARGALDALLARSSVPKDGESEAALALARRTAEAFGTDRVGFLRAAALHADPDGLDFGAERVGLLTLHGAKGLEFPVVFIAGCEDGLIPFRRPGGPPADLAEERRLMYVGATRAREILVLSYARRRTRYGRTAETVPSPFLRDLEAGLLHFSPAPPPPSSRPSGREQLGLFGEGGESA
ncbi:MAG: UvrD-helicase domain-containing protein [Thermodesulfobacteriota bacterium]